MSPITQARLTARTSMFALVASGVLAGAMMLPTDAAARGFGGGHFSGGGHFAGGGIGARGFAAAGPRSIGPGAGAFARAGKIAAPARSALTPRRFTGGNLAGRLRGGKPGGAATVIATPCKSACKGGGTHLPPVAGLQPTNPVSGPIKPPPGFQPPPGVHLPPNAGLVPKPGDGTIKPPPGLHLPPGVRPTLPPGLQPKPPSPPGNTVPPPGAANPNPPAGPDHPPVAPPPAAGGYYEGGIVTVGLVETVAPVVAEAPVEAYVAGPTCNRILPNGCYLAMRKFSLPNGSELRCTMICD